MTKKYEILTLCGSMKFSKDFVEQQKRLTLEGKIVMSVVPFRNDEDFLNEEQKTMLDEMHRRKIDLSDSILVINVGGYIGSSTQGEIEYALNTGKKVSYLVAGGLTDQVRRLE